MHENVLSPDAVNVFELLCRRDFLFEDADKDPDPEMLVDLSWEDTKAFFIANVKAFSI